MRKILFGLIAALMTTTAMARGGPPTVTVQYNFGPLTFFSYQVDPRQAGELLAQCHSKGTVGMLGLAMPCTDLAIDAAPGGSRVITVYITFPL